MLRKIDVLHAQSQCLEQAHARSIQHTRHERRRPSALEPCEHSAHLVLGQDEAILDCDAREPRTRKTRAVAAFKRAVRRTIHTVFHVERVYSGSTGPVCVAKSAHCRAKDPVCATKSPDSRAQDPVCAAKSPDSHAKDPVCAAKSPDSHTKDPVCAAKSPHCRAKAPGAARQRLSTGTRNRSTVFWTLIAPKWKRI